MYALDVNGAALSTNPENHRKRWAASKLADSSGRCTKPVDACTPYFGIECSNAWPLRNHCATTARLL
eukprot:scaffold19605_cov23-Tisochrysis_lutea.AAC.1